jgi:hypothetical protein
MWYWYVFMTFLIFDVGFVCGVWWLNGKRIADKTEAYDM